MPKPNAPNPSDPMDFMKNMWGSMTMPGMNIPGMVMPTLSVEEIQKKITDLKAVESWLELNMNMLRGTIQALEVQAATIAALQSMGNALNASMKPGQDAQHYDRQKAPEDAKPNQKPSSAPQPGGQDEADAASLTAPLVNAAAWWNMLQDQFKQAVDNAAEGSRTPSAGGNGDAAADNKTDTPPDEESSASKARRKPASK